ncbi:hypothetical protein AB0D27_43940, partial [Streptomyces sp. NPDC048415]
MAGRGAPGASSNKYDGTEGRRRAQGLRVVCACGWRGPRRPADFADPDACDEGLQKEWIRHTEVSMSRTLPERLRRLLDDVEEAAQALTSAFRLGGVSQADRGGPWFWPPAVKRVWLGPD